MRIGNEYIDYRTWTQIQLDHLAPPGMPESAVVRTVDPTVPALVFGAIWNFIRSYSDDSLIPLGETPEPLITTEIGFWYRENRYSLSVRADSARAGTLAVRLAQSDIETDLQADEHELDVRCHYRRLRLFLSPTIGGLPVILRRITNVVVESTADWVEDRLMKGIRRRHAQAVNAICKIVRDNFGKHYSSVLLWAVDQKSGVYVCDERSLAHIQLRIRERAPSALLSFANALGSLLLTDLPLNSTLLSQEALAKNMPVGGDLKFAPYNGSNTPLLLAELAFFGEGSLICVPLLSDPNRVRLVATMPKAVLPQIEPLLTESFLNQIRQAVVSNQLEVPHTPGGGRAGDPVREESVRIQLITRVEQMWDLARKGVETADRDYVYYRSCLDRIEVASAAAIQTALLEGERQWAQRKPPGSCLEKVSAALSRGAHA